MIVTERGQIQEPISAWRLKGPAIGRTGWRESNSNFGNRRFLKKLDSIGESYGQFLEGVGSAAEKVVLLPETLAYKHPKLTSVGTAGVVLAILLAIGIIDTHPDQDRQSMPQGPQASLSASASDKPVEFAPKLPEIALVGSPDNQLQIHHPENWTSNRLGIDIQRLSSEGKKVNMTISTKLGTVSKEASILTNSQDPKSFTSEEFSTPSGLQGLKIHWTELNSDTVLLQKGSQVIQVAVSRVQLTTPAIEAEIGKIINLIGQ